MISDAGAYTYQGINLHYNASTNFPGPYVLPHYKLHVSVVETNKVPTAPVRGAGYPEGCFAMERVLDAIARELGLDKAEIRRRNLIPAEAMPYRTPMRTRSDSAPSSTTAATSRPASIWRCARRTTPISPPAASRRVAQARISASASPPA